MTIDTFPSPGANHERDSRLSDAGRDKLGRSGLFLSAMHFYKTDEEPFVGSMGGEYRVIIPNQDTRDISKNKVIGNGETITASLEDTLEGMRSLETIKTRELARIEMSDSAHVNFTSLSHYSPRMSPGTETYRVPDYLQETVLADESLDTYEKTVNKEGWESDVRSVINDYVTQTPDGGDLADHLGIHSLDHITPEQAIKLSVGLVQNLSKYSWRDMVTQQQSAADHSTTAELLREGIAHRDNPNWQGNGVCRNIAPNVKAVFESLKATQDDMSMLNNTYATVATGYNGQGYQDTRDKRGQIGEITTGHAWNSFTTIDRDGSAVVTIVDVTSVLEQGAPAVQQSIDKTAEYTAAKLRTFVEKSTTQDQALEGYREYIDTLVVQDARKGVSIARRLEIEKFALSEYLGVSSGIRDLRPDGDYLSDRTVSTAYRLRKELNEGEVMELLRLNRLSSSEYSEKVSLIVDSYEKAHPV